MNPIYESRVIHFTAQQEPPQDGLRMRMGPSFFSEVYMLPDGSSIEYVRLERVERWMLEKDHEIALLMDQLNRRN